MVSLFSVAIIATTITWVVLRLKDLFSESPVFYTQDYDAGYQQGVKEIQQYQTYHHSTEDPLPFQEWQNQRLNQQMITTYLKGD